MNLPWVYTCSPSWTPSHLPPHTIPLGHPSTPVPSIPYHASNLDWQFVSHMIIYMFQCHSPKSSHPYPLPQSPKVCSLYLCLFICLTYRDIVTIFLNSIYALIYCIGVFLSDLLHSVYEVKSLSRVRLCNPMDCSLPDASVHGIFQATVLMSIAISLSRGSSQPRDWTWFSLIAGRCFTIWATRENNRLQFHPPH